ncbi:hypothetical protein [Janibacter limosus]|uniref:hypothetical protein n=1 Tax=Janibacter limosus TaxID=53458 RepID=UPI00083756B5|nr:hypothetical protein [Janibacter limosus]
MDPVRGLIHLGLKMTETTLDRALDVVRLADTLLVATAVPPMHERDADASAWPDEEQADLDALSATLRARRSEPATTSEAQVSTTRTTPRKKTTPRNTSTKKAAPARKAPAKPASAKKRTATKATTSPAKKTAKKTTRKAATTPAKTAKKAVKKTATSAPAPTLSVLPDA